MDISRWEDLILRLGLASSPELIDVGQDLIQRHTERHRAYHTGEHIAACIGHLERFASANPARIEMAFWFHDAIYKPMSKTNEADSAKLAADKLSGYLSKSNIGWIEQAIILTANHGHTDDPDTALMLDIDLSILGTAPDVYEEYTRNIRREYRRVPGFIYRKGRADVLRHFLGLPTIYKTPETLARWEVAARKNLSQELSELT